MSTQAYAPRIPSDMSALALRQPSVKQLYILDSTVFTYQWKQERSSYTHALQAYFSFFQVICSQLPGTRTPDNSNLFLFPLKVRVIGIRLQLTLVSANHASTEHKPKRLLFIAVQEEVNISKYAFLYPVNINNTVIHCSRKLEKVKKTDSTSLHMLSSSYPGVCIHLSYLARRTLSTRWRKFVKAMKGMVGKIVYGQEPMSRSMQLHYISVTAFLQTDSFLDRIPLE